MVKEEKPLKETTRLEIFSDGVFAIAITLLVLELIQTLHPGTDATILENIKHHWQSFLAFAIGFITILICWINHHTALDYIVKTDNRFMWINGFLLFVVTLTPFPTAVLAEYLTTDGKTALAVYGFNYLLIAVAADSICTYAYNHQLVNADDRKYFHSFKRIYRYGLFYTVVAFAVCFISMFIAICMYCLLFLVFSSPKSFAAKLDKLKR